MTAQATPSASPTRSSPLGRLALGVLAGLAFATQPTLSVAQAAQAQPTFAGRADVQAFVADMVERHGFARRDLDALFSRARHQPSVIRAMTPQVKGTRSWQQYRARFVTRDRIDGGTAFWSRHAVTLERAASEYGVPAEIIVAIIGVETEYGRIMGDYRVADALATLAFDYPRRADFFRGELEQFLLLARDVNADAFSFRGSFAGAVGLPQFMPGSYRRYAVDYDGDGRRDLRGSAVDAIGSVAHFLRGHGWQPGEPTAHPATLTTPSARELADGGVDPSRSAAELRIAGVDFDPAVADETPCVLVELDSTDAASVFWVGYTNFYVVTRYNRSSFYAISVIELAQALRAARRPE